MAYTSRLPISTNRPRGASTARPAGMASPTSELSTTSTPRPPVTARTSSAKPMRAGVEDVLDAERPQVVALVRAAGGGEHLGAGPPAELQGGQPDAAGGGVDQHPLAAAHPAELVQARSRRSRMATGKAAASRPIEVLGPGDGERRRHGDEATPACSCRGTTA